MLLNHKPATQLKIMSCNAVVCFRSVPSSVTPGIAGLGSMLPLGIPVPLGQLPGLVPSVTMPTSNTAEVWVQNAQQTVSQDKQEQDRLQQQRTREMEMAERRARELEAEKARALEAEKAERLRLEEERQRLAEERRHLEELRRQQEQVLCYSFILYYLSYMPSLL